VSPETTHDLTLSTELAGGPSVDVWAPTATLLPSLDDDTPGPPGPASVAYDTDGVPYLLI